MIQDNKILVVGGMGSGKTTLIDALVGRKVLSGNATSEITCLYNEEAYDTPPVIDSCNLFIGVKLSPNISKLQVCFIDTPSCWDDISILKRLIRINQINNVLCVIRCDLVDVEYNYDLIKFYQSQKPMSFIA